MLKKYTHYDNDLLVIREFITSCDKFSVDIDLTYLPIEDRSTTIENIAAALTRIKKSIEKKTPGISATLKRDIGKLLISSREASIKIEVNLVGRGVIADPEIMILCKGAQNNFDSFCEIQVVPLGQLYGGKICAALDRQHPRDLFDVKYLLENEGFNDAIKTGFIYCLLGSERPINEILNPNLIDQKLAMENQFEGMTLASFTYEDYENVRMRLIGLINSSLTPEDKDFLLNFKNLMPEWDKYNFQEFPSVRWKLQNLERLREKKPIKHAQSYKQLKDHMEKTT